MSELQSVAPYYRRLFEVAENPDGNSTLSKFFYRGLGAIGGMSFGLGRNYRLGRPFSAGLTLTVLSAAVFSAGGEMVRRMVQESADYDLRRTYHYIITHPEDFPEPKRVKFSEMFYEWEAVR